MRSLLYSGWLLLLLGLVLWGGGSAHALVLAAPPDVSSSCDDDAECSRLADEGYEHLQAGRLQKARRSYEAAYARRKDPKLLYNLGRVCQKAGQPTEAVGYYQHYLDAGAEGIEEQRQKAQQYLNQARSEAATQQFLNPTPRAGAHAASTLPDAKYFTQQTPLYKRWWLWTVVGVATACVAVGVGLGVAARRPDVTDAGIARPFQ